MWRSFRSSVPSMLLAELTDSAVDQPPLSALGGYKSKYNFAGCHEIDVPGSNIERLPPAVKPDSQPARLLFPVFLTFFIIYLFTWAGHYTSGDGSHKIAWAKAMIATGSIAGSQQNSVDSKYGIGHSLLAVPPLALASIVTKTTGIHCDAALYTLMFVANGALFLALLGFYLAHFYPIRSVWLTLFIAGIATSWWPFTKLDLSESLVLIVGFLGFVVMSFGGPLSGQSGANATSRKNKPARRTYKDGGCLTQSRCLEFHNETFGETCLGAVLI